MCAQCTREVKGVIYAEDCIANSLRPGRARSGSASSGLRLSTSLRATIPPARAPIRW